MAKLGRGSGQALLVAAGLLAGSFAGGEAHAQSLFCPANPGVPPGGSGAAFAMATGRCTNGDNGTGAFSGAALGSQSLSDLASGSTESTNRAASGMVTERRQGAQFACPAGTVRIGGQCQAPPRAQSRGDSQLPARTRIPDSVRARSEAGPARARKRMETRVVKRGNRMVRVRTPVAEEPVDSGLVAVPAFVQAELAPSFGVFGQGFGDYEERNGTSGSSLRYVMPGPLGDPGQGPTLVVPLQIVSKSNATSFGAIGGIDHTTRGIFSQDDGLIVGVLGGFLQSNVKISSQILSFDASLANGGSSSLSAHASGGSVGGFATYFNGPVSLDVLYKADFLNLTERFTDNQAYSATFDYNGALTQNAPQNALVAGQGKTSLVNHSLVANINYRVPLWDSFWIEPTAGIQARWTDYSSSASALGLANGHLLRVQGGARLGWEFEYAGMRITPILTGLAYSDVTVTGGFVDFAPNGAFGATTSQIGVAGSSVINIRQQGLLRGQGILTVVADLGSGWTAFVQGDVRGGKDLFGAGGKGGIRYQW